MLAGEAVTEIDTLLSSETIDSRPTVLCEQRDSFTPEGGQWLESVGMGRKEDSLYLR